MLGSPFKSRPNYVFDYKPRYYDAQKERLENLKRKYQNKDFSDKEFKITITKDNLKTDWNRNKHLAYDKKSNIRLAVIIAILIGFFAYFLDLHKLF